jgi:anaerobic sulfite reductase subunit B
MTNVYMPQKAQILEITPQTDIDYTFRLRANMKPEHGQFLQLSIPKIGEAPISISDYNNEYIELTIRKVGTVTDAIHELNPGDYVFIRGPYGHGFPVNNFKGKNVIIAAGGTGLAPVKSIINRFYRNPGEINKLNIMAGFKSPKDILFRDEINMWKEKFEVLLTVDNGDKKWNGNVGLITKFIPEIDIENPDNTIVIVVGPPMMMKFTCLEFLKRSIPEENIWVSFERKMSCGIGKCGHCKINETYVCLEGPVFNYPKSKELLD